MRNLGKRGLALLLTLLMLVSLVPTSFAEDASEDVSNETEFISAEVEPEEAVAEEPAAEEPVAEEPVEEEPAAEEAEPEEVVANDAANTIQPEVVINLTNDAGGIKVTWSYDGAAGSAESYIVMRSNGTGEPQFLYKEEDPSITSYTDNSEALVNGTSYTYNITVVTATDQGYKKANERSIVCVKAVSISSITNTVNGLKITWPALTNAKGYYIYRSDDGSFSGMDPLDAKTGALNDKIITTNYYEDTTTTADQVYYYLVRAIASDGTRGSYIINGDGTYGTASVRLSVPAMSTALVNNVSKGVYLSWTPITVPGKTITYRIYRRATTDAGWSTSWYSTSSTNSFTDTGVTSGTAYYYAVAAYDETDNIVGMHESSGILNLYLSTPSLTKPVNHQSYITLTWTQVTGATGYKIYRRASDESPASFADTDGSLVKAYYIKTIQDGATTTWNDNSIVAGTVYYYTVVAINGDDISGYDTVGASACALPTPILIDATNDVNGIKLTWKKLSGIETYNIYRRKANENAYGTPITVDTTGVDAEWTDNSVQNGVTYVYTITAVNGINNESAFADPLTVTRLATPIMGYTSNPAKSITNQESGIQFYWNAVSGATSYNIYRDTYDPSTGAWSGFVKIQSGVTGTSYTDKSVSPGYSYKYSVAAVKGTTTGDYDKTGLSMERLLTVDFTVENATTGGVRIAWKQVAGAEGYYIYRKVSGASKYGTPIDTVSPGDVTEYIDTDASLEVGKTYVYTVRAFGNDPINNPDILSWYAPAGKSLVYVSGYPTLKSVANTKNGLTVTWEKMTGASSYVVYRRTTNTVGVTTTEPEKLGTTSQLSYTDTKNIQNGYTYTYYVRGVVKGAYSAYDTTGISRTFVTTPTLQEIKNVIDTGTPSQTDIKLTWKEVSDPAGKGIGYIVLRKYKTDTKWAYGYEKDVTAEVTVDNGIVTWIDTEAKVGATYTYTVRAYVGSCTITETNFSDGRHPDTTDGTTNDISAWDSTGKTMLVLRTPTTISAVCTASAGTTVVTWQATAGATGYRILRRLADGSDDWTKIGQVSGETKSTYKDTSAKVGVIYNYTVEAVNGSYIGAHYEVADNNVWGVRVQKVKLSGAASNVQGGVINAQAENATSDTYNSGVMVTWNKFNWDSSMTSILKFNIYRKLPGEKTFSPLITIDGFDADGNMVTSYLDPDPVDPKQTVAYSVEAVYEAQDNQGNSIGDSTCGYNTSGVKAKYAPAPATIETAGGNYEYNAKKAIFKDGIQISWTDGGSITPSNYAVYRKLPGGSWKKIATVKGSVNEYIDFNVVPNNDYIYTVRAIYSGNYSGYWYAGVIGNTTK